jgi:hypothetical protein
MGAIISPDDETGRMTRNWQEGRKGGKKRRKYDSIGPDIELKAPRNRRYRIFTGAQEIRGVTEVWSSLGSNQTDI